MELKYRWEKIKLLAFDVDGVLTTGGIIYDNQDNEFKQFNVKDGFIFQPLKEAGIALVAITGRNSEVVRRRLKELAVDEHYHGVKNKLEVLKQVANDFDLDAQEILYVGDDLPDLACIRWAGIGACPADAPSYMHEYADHLCQARGGMGVIRELGEQLLSSKSLWNNFLKKYL